MGGIRRPFVQKLLTMAAAATVWWHNAGTPFEQDLGESICSALQMLRVLRGVRRSVPAAVLLQELGELPPPVAVEWKRQALRFGVR